MEEFFLAESGQDLLYQPDEKIGAVVVRTFPELGRLAALRFLEWARDNPEGVVSLPTGKTPEYFIREVKRLISGWKKREVQQELERVGMAGGATPNGTPNRKPDLRGLYFVQIDEFYPINPLHHNSFYYYVSEFYIKGFGLDPARALLIDCSQIGLPRAMSLEEVWCDDEVDLTLRYRSARNAQERLQKKVIESIDQWCTEYEDRIRQRGGIQFFLGGIGPDGHIGFNIRGSDLNSTTRLASINYETQASAAQDLGGIEVAKKRLVITIGLDTITQNPDCVALVMAAGEAKKRIVAESISSAKHVRYPASVLQSLPAARFYITEGAAKDLHSRNCSVMATRESISDEEQERIVIDLALQLGKPLLDLTQRDFDTTPFGRLLRTRVGNAVMDLRQKVYDRLVSGIEAAMVARGNRTFLHTEPHHDDTALGYLPFVVRHIRDWSNVHHFVTLTSGFTAVTNLYMLNKLRRLKDFLQGENFRTLAGKGYFDPQNARAKNRDVWQYLDGVGAHSKTLSEEGEMRRLSRDLIEVFDEINERNLEDRTNELINYFETQYPGRKDLPHIQRLKGMCREWESDCLWGYFGWNADSVHHLRLGFYTGDVFTEEPTRERDVAPVLDLLRTVNPDVVTVALDPEASGPDTHYKVMQVISEALKIHEQKTGRHDIEILGYRNVWYRFHPSEADLFVPVSLMMFSLQHSAFMHTFVSQKDASFPSYEHDGPFSELAQKIQVGQYRMLKTCLGRGYFHEHPSALIRATRGMVFLKQMSPDEFYTKSRELRERTERTR